MPSLIIIIIVPSLGKHGATHHRLVSTLANLRLKLFPSRMGSITEFSAAAHATTGSDYLGLSLHAEGFLGLRLILGWTHDPILVLFLLVFEELNVFG